MTDAAGILNQYDERHPEFERFQERLSRLITDLLRESSISVHKIEGRVKPKRSLSLKLEREDSSYTDISEVPDVIGLRVITYYSDDVDRVTNLIHQEFDVDDSRSTDRRQSMDPDRFGYLSVHLLCRVGKGRRANAEWRPWADCVFEVQVRSLLQHAWAEIEHDLGYKDKQGVRREVVPPDIVRPFSRLAGVFELADLEFVRIRTSQASYSEKIAKDLTQRGSATQDEPLTAVSLSALLAAEGSKAAQLDGEIVKIWGRTLNPGVDAGYVSRRADQLRRSGLTTIGEVRDSLVREEKRMLQLAKLATGKPTFPRPVPKGVSFYYLVLALASTLGTPEAVRKRLVEALDAANDPGQVRVVSSWTRRIQKLL